VRLLVWAPGALLDIRDIEAWLDGIDPGLAGRIVDEIEYCAERLLEFPWSGPPIGKSPFRKLSITRFNYLVFYRVTAEHVEISRVRHAHADWSPR
jgi:plasmid stabilization system protein ParE